MPKTRWMLPAVLLLLVLAFVAWHEMPQLRRWLQLPAGLGGASELSTLPATPAGVHKCLQGSQVVYSDAPCPHGQQEQAIKQGTVTVMKSPAPAEAASSASSPKTVRDLLVKPDEPSLLDRQIERATR